MRYSHLFFLNMFMLSAYFQQADLLLFIIWLFSITAVSDECLGSASFRNVFFVAKLQLCSWKNDEKLESPTLSVLWMNFVTCTPSEFLNNPVFVLYDNLALLIFTPKLALSEYYSPKLLKGICNIVSNLLYNLLLQLSCRSGQLTQDAVSNSISLKFVCFYIRMFFLNGHIAFIVKGCCLKLSTLDQFSFLLKLGLLWLVPRAWHTVQRWNPPLSLGTQLQMSKKRIWKPNISLQIQV